MGQTFPHCAHSTLAAVKVGGGADEASVRQALREAYEELDGFSVREDKLAPGCGECCRNRNTRDADFAGAFRTAGCGWVDYQYWHLPQHSDYGSAGGPELRVFSHSSNFLCDCFPHVVRLCCASFCICYGDGGNNRGYIDSVVGHINQKHPGMLSDLRHIHSSC